MLRSFLYAPGDQPELVAKALSSDSHAVIVDLEDGVAPKFRPNAHRLAAESLRERGVGGPVVAVRVALESLELGLEVAVGGGVDLVYLPKAEMAALGSCDRLLSQLENTDSTRGPIGVVALIETAQGLLDCVALAHSQRVVGLALGEADLFADLGIDPGLPEPERHSLRLPLVVASAAAGLRGPTAPASTEFRQLEQFRATCVGLRRLGFGARSAIHPAQVAVINEVFAPSPEEVAQAQAVVDAFDAAVADGRGIVVGPDGSMVDEAVVRSARRLLT